ncbi:MAG: thiamine pyrophosphate-dependent dehydrogenase E1 component subunit alpha [Chloroflexota bacterium]|nr:thiamine pyrophosphate-dependent dehydrogenase E1 component subunit alpha [Chloroflexota bacterium]
MTTSIDQIKKSSMLRHLIRIRQFEDRVADLLDTDDINCPTHLYTGQEAVAVGVCQALSTDDYIWGTHRSHGHYLAKGGNMDTMMAELYGKETGCSHGRGGSMHLLAKEVGILGTVPMVGATIPMAVGSALVSSIKKDQKVSVAFFGDGATEEGVFHEALNFASLKKLPVIFVCENNLYSSHLRIEDRRSQNNIYKSAEAHGMEGITVDGNNTLDVYQKAVEAVTKARSGLGPTLIECKTYRWRGHVGPSWDLDVNIREKEELDHWMEKDPIEILSKEMIQTNEITPQDLDAIKQAVASEIESSVEFARKSPFPDVKELSKNVYSSS